MRRANIAAILFHISRAADDYLEGGVIYHNGLFDITDDLSNPNVLAVGKFWDTIQTTGNSRLHVQTSDNTLAKDGDYFYGMGYAEGYLTAKRISQQVHNRVRQGEAEPPAVWEWMENHNNYVRKQIDHEVMSDPYWFVMSLQMNRLDGLLAGYQARVRDHPANLDRNVTLMDLFMLNAVSDLDEIKRGLNVGTLKSDDDRCSALVKFTNGELFVGHATWSDYSEMLRTFKTLHFPHVRHPAVATTTISYSSYPGYLSSTDDWYTMLPTRLVVTETTLRVMSDKLIARNMTLASVLTPIRALVASTMAGTGSEWYNTFSRYNSGTQNNQWMVVDFKKFNRAKKLQSASLEKGTFLVFEQMPGSIRVQDKTDHLLQHS